MAEEQKKASGQEFPPLPSGEAPSYSEILQEHDVGKSQRDSRRKLLTNLEKKEFNNGHEPNGVVAHIGRVSLGGPDIPVLGSVLRQIGDVDTLNLILQSPGGEGTCVEKVVSLCRAQCKHFRVIIPNEAKSAATMIALGSDEIVMGPCSEIGPIDAQIPVISNGLFRYISAQSYIDAKVSLLKQYDTAKNDGKDTQAILQMIASLDIPFIEECQRMMDFGRDVVSKLLAKHMFKRVPAKERDAKIRKIVDTLSSVELFKVHGRVIDGNTARRELGLNVKLLGKNDPLWKTLWEYYTRSEIAMTQASVKMFETKHEILVARSRPE